MCLLTSPGVIFLARFELQGRAVGLGPGSPLESGSGLVSGLVSGLGLVSGSGWGQRFR